MKSLSTTHLFLLMLLLAYAPLLLSWSFFGTKETIPSFYQAPSAKNRPVTIMIDPTGDARNPGRIVDDAFERTIAFHCAQELKQALELRNPTIRIILTKYAGETTEPLQNATFANRLQVDFFISLHFYKEHQKQSTFYLYHTLYHPITDLWYKKEDILCLQPYDQAYKNSLQKTINLGTLFLASLKKEEKEYNFTCYDLLGVPFKPLVGIIAPALAIEIGIIHSTAWKKYVLPLAQACTEVITTLVQEKSHDTNPQTNTLLPNLQ